MIRTRTVEPREIDWRAIKNKTAGATGTLVAPDTVLLDKDGAPLLVHAKFPGSLIRVRTAVEGIPMASGMRAQGQKSNSRTFGWMPRNPVFQQYGCHRALVQESNPAAAQVVEDFSAEMADLLRRWAPVPAAAQEAVIAERLSPEYVIPGGMFTSGIINQTWEIRYHLDRLNFKGSWSAMIVFRDGTAGGHLDIPQLGVTLACPDESVVLFDGQAFWHGVTPIQKVRSRSYRISIVWYARQDMCNCLPWADEVAFAADRETRSAIMKI